MINTSYQALTRRYIFALSLIAMLAITAFITLHQLIKTEKTSAVIVNLSGRQRMLSQKAALLGLQLVISDDLAKRQILRNELLETVNLMEKTHAGFLQGNADINLPGNPSPSIRELFYGQPVALDKHLREFVDEGRALAGDPAEKLSLENPHLVYILKGANGDFLKSLDLVVRQYQSESEAKVARLQVIETVALVVTLFVLSLEALFIFRPMVSTIIKEKQQYEDINKQLELLSSLDGLTGIANRRYLDNYLLQEWRRAARENIPLSLIMCDIDFFKVYNDTYGHQAGDDCLKRVAGSLSENLKRPGDLVARYGGEEFAIVLPDTDTDGAVLLAKALRAGIEALKIEHINSRASKHVTLSLGVASTVPSNDFSPEMLISRADQALYQAKQKGRNQVQVSAE
ncbi:MAG: diguanylate cyclase [Bacillota bacterium]